MCNSAVLCVTAYECVDRDRARLYGVCLCDKNIQENSMRERESEREEKTENSSNKCDYIIVKQNTNIQ